MDKVVKTMSGDSAGAIAENVAALEARGDDALRRALESSWMEGDLPADVHRDVLYITSKHAAGFMAPLLYAMNSGRVTRGQIATALILLRILSERSSLGVTPQDTLVSKRSFLEALLAPGVGDSTVVRGMVGAARDVLALSPGDFPGGVDSHGAALEPALRLGLSRVMEGLSEKLLRVVGGSGITPSPVSLGGSVSPVLSQERVRGAMEGDVLAELNLLGKRSVGAQVVRGYLGFLTQVYEVSVVDGYLSPPAFIASRSRGFFAERYPSVYGEFVAMDPALFPCVVRGASLLMKGGDEFLFSLLGQLPYLSGARVAEFGALVDEYNWDWAVAAFEWGE